jgi:phosphatidylglycerophosphate synthase
VTLAVLCGSTGNALSPETAGEVRSALLAAGATRVIDVNGPDLPGQLAQIAALARETDEPLLLCADDLVAHPSLLWTLATEPAGRSTALVMATESGEGGDLREDRGRLVPAVDGPTRFLGALCLARADLGLVVAAMNNTRGPGGGTDLLVKATNAVDVLLPGLLAAGLVPIATRVRLLYAERVRTADRLSAARAAVAAVDEDKALLRLAVKEKDDFFTTYAVSSWSPLVTKLCARAKLTPSQVTALSVLFAVAAALAFWQASRPALIIGAVLLYLGFVLDCVDGQLARYTRKFGAFGGWLDTMADRAKEYVAYAGLAAGAERLGLSFAWPLAITAIVLQTARHMTDTWYGALHDEAAARQAVGTAGNADAGGGVGARLSRASNKVQADTGSIAYWLKRIVVFPIGERWALIAVLAAIWNGRVALAAVVIWGLLAAAYTLGLRSLRSISMRVGVLDTVDTSRHRDDGRMVRSTVSAAGLSRPLIWALLAAIAPLALIGAVAAGRVPHGTPWQAGNLEWVRAGEAGIWLVVVAVLVLGAGAAARSSHGGPLDWLVPAALRAAEYLTAVAVAMICDVPPPVVFTLLFVLALHHYDLTARMEKGAPDLQVKRALLGWDGRVVVLVFFALAGVATFGELLLAIGVGVHFLTGAVKDWRTGGSR